MAMIRLVPKNYETVQIQYFVPTAPEQAVVEHAELGIPFQTGDLATAAALVGIYDNFLSKVIPLDEIDEHTKKTVESARTRLTETLKSAAPAEKGSGLILPDSGLIVP